MKKRIFLGLFLVTFSLLSSCKNIENNNENENNKYNLKTAIASLNDATSYELGINTNFKSNYFGYEFLEGFYFNAKYELDAYEYTLIDNAYNETKEKVGFANYKNDVFTYQINDDLDVVPGKIIDLNSSIKTSSRAKVNLFKDVNVPPLIKEDQNIYSLDIDKTSDMNLVKNFIKVSGFNYNQIKNELSDLEISFSDDVLSFTAKIKEVYDLTITVSSINSTSLNEIHMFLNEGNKPLEFNPLLMDAIDLGINSSHTISFIETSEENLDVAYINVDNYIPYIYVDYADNTHNNLIQSIINDFVLIPIKDKAGIENNIYAIEVNGIGKPLIDINDLEVLKEQRIFPRDVDFSNKEKMIEELKKSLIWKDEMYGTFNSFYFDDYYFTFDGPILDDEYPNDYLFMSNDFELLEELTMVYQPVFQEFLPAINAAIDIVSEDKININSFITQTSVAIDSENYFNFQQIYENFDNLNIVSKKFVEDLINDIY